MYSSVVCVCAYAPGSQRLLFHKGEMGMATLEEFLRQTLAPTNMSTFYFFTLAAK